MQRTTATTTSAHLGPELPRRLRSSQESGQHREPKAGPLKCPTQRTFRCHSPQTNRRGDGCPPEPADESMPPQWRETEDSPPTPGRSPLPGTGPLDSGALPNGRRRQLRLPQRKRSAPFPRVKANRSGGRAGPHARIQMAARAGCRGSKSSEPRQQRPGDKDQHWPAQSTFVILRSISDTFVRKLDSCGFQKLQLQPFVDTLRSEIGVPPVAGIVGNHSCDRIRRAQPARPMNRMAILESLATVLSRSPGFNAIAPII